MPLPGLVREFPDNHRRYLERRNETFLVPRAERGTICLGCGCPTHRRTLCVPCAARVVSMRELLDDAQAFMLARSDREEFNPIFDLPDVWWDAWLSTRILVRRRVTPDKQPFPTELESILSTWDSTISEY